MKSTSTSKEGGGGGDLETHLAPPGTSAWLQRRHSRRVCRCQWSQDPSSRCGPGSGGGTEGPDSLPARTAWLDQYQKLGLCERGGRVPEKGAGALETFGAVLEIAVLLTFKDAFLPQCFCLWPLVNELL